MTNPTTLQVSAFLASYLAASKFTIHAITLVGENTFELRGPRGAVYTGIRNKHDGAWRFLNVRTQKQLSLVVVVDAQGVLQARA